jgi:hypothetical protein
MLAKWHMRSSHKGMERSNVAQELVRAKSDGRLVAANEIAQRLPYQEHAVAQPSPLLHLGWIFAWRFDLSEWRGFVVEAQEQLRKRAQSRETLVVFRRVVGLGPARTTAANTALKGRQHHLIW